MSEISPSGSTLDASRGASVHPNEEAKEKNNVMESVQLSDAVFDDFTSNYNQVYGGHVSTEYTYQIICAGIQLYHRGHSQLSFVTSPDHMAKKTEIWESMWLGMTMILGIVGRNGCRS